VCVHSTCCSLVCLVTCGGSHLAKMIHHTVWVSFLCMLLSENWFHFLENSQRHHYAADASVYLVNIKRQIYYAHRQKKCSIFKTRINYLPSELVVRESSKVCTHKVLLPTCNSNHYCCIILCQLVDVSWCCVCVHSSCLVLIHYYVSFLPAYLLFT
jgi:hypothetical protein